MKIVAWNDMSEELRAEARANFPAILERHDPKNLMFVLRKDGHVTRSKSGWNFTGRFMRVMMEQMHAPVHHPGKGLLDEWKPGVTFTTMRG